MKINEINKKLYEDCFITDGEYVIPKPTWKPSIDEREITEHQGDGDGHWVPATPLGYRNYKESRIEGLRAILNQDNFIDLTNDKNHHLKKEDNIISLYDKIKTDSGEYVIVGDSDDRYYLANKDNKLFYTLYEQS